MLLFVSELIQEVSIGHFIQQVFTQDQSQRNRVLTVSQSIKKVKPLFQLSASKKKSKPKLFQVLQLFKLVFIGLPSLSLKTTFEMLSVFIYALNFF
jgi:hypothetical protein